MLATGNDGGVRSQLGYWSSWVWSLFMLTALVAAVATLRGRYRVEYIVLPLFGVALLVAIVAAWVHFGFDPDWQRAARAASASALVFFLAARHTNLRRIVKAVKAHEPWTKQ